MTVQDAPLVPLTRRLATTSSAPWIRLCSGSTLPTPKVVMDEILAPGLPRQGPLLDSTLELLGKDVAKRWTLKFLGDPATAARRAGKARASAESTGNGGHGAPSRRLQPTSAPPFVPWLIRSFVQIRRGSETQKLWPESSLPRRPSLTATAEMVALPNMLDRLRG